MFNWLIEILFPKFCYGCSINGTYICEDCTKKYIRFNWVHRCHVCSKEVRKGLMHDECKEKSYLDGLIYVCAYDGIVKEMLHDIKYQYIYSITEDLGFIMARFLKYYNFKEDLIFTSVPVHKYKKNLRGFNQAELLAKEMLKYSDYKYFEILKRIKKTKTQVTLNKSDRAVNLKGSFELQTIADKLDKKTKIVIIDDVYTTGATLNECAKALKEQGFEEVIGFTFAKTGG